MGRCVCKLKDKFSFCPQGVEINSKTYQHLILETEIMHATSNLFNNGPWIFQQDSAPAHASRATLSSLSGQNIDFLSKAECPLLALILILLLPRVKNLQNRACSKPHKNLESLRQALTKEWKYSYVPQKELRKSVRQFERDCKLL